MLSRLVYDNRGQSLVEAAMVIPLLLFILMGMFAAGFWLNDQMVVTAAAREGVRQGSLTGDCNAIKDSVAKTMQIIDTNPKHIHLSVTDPFPDLGSDLTVQVKYDVPLTFGFFKSDYEKENATTSFPFAEAVGQAVAKMEAHPASSTLQGCQ